MSLLGGVSLSCLVGAIGLMANWAVHRRDRLGREKNLPVLSVSVLMVLALLAALPGTNRKVQERRLERVASLLAGFRVDVHCQDGAEAFLDAGAELGWVAFGPDGVPERRTLIKREQCRHLNAYLDSDKTSPSRDEVVAVHVLTHEAMHMRGERDEVLTECQAVQRDAVTARELGASPQAAVELALRYYRAVYPWMPDDYVSRECRPGGALDEQLGHLPW